MRKVLISLAAVAAATVMAASPAAANPRGYGYGGYGMGYSSARVMGGHRAAIVMPWGSGGYNAYSGYGYSGRTYMVRRNRDRDFDGLDDRMERRRWH